MSSCRILRLSPASVSVAIQAANAGLSARQKVTVWVEVHASGEHSVAHQDVASVLAGPSTDSSFETLEGFALALVASLSQVVGASRVLVSVRQRETLEGGIDWVELSVGTGWCGCA